jgi:hypothetical protein
VDYGGFYSIIIMPSLSYRQQKIQEKRKQTSFRDFVMEIASWRSLTFYKNKEFTSKYPPNDRVQNLVSHKIFVEGDNVRQDELPIDSGFFSALQSLLQKTAISPTIVFSGSENSIFSDQTVNSANVYLSNITISSKNVLYSLGTKLESENIISSCVVRQSENVYESMNVSESFGVFYSNTIHNSSNVRRCNNLIGCHFCYKCHDLENQSYCINNQQFTKEQYTEMVKSLLSVDRHEKQLHLYKGQNINCQEIIGA